MDKVIPEAPPATKILNADFIKLWLGFLMMMLNLSIFNLLPYYLELRGASPDTYGSVAGSMGVANVLSLILLGHRADAWSRKATVLFYFMISMMGNFLCLWAMGQPHLEWFYGVRLMQGVFMGLGFPILTTWMVEVTPPEQKHTALAWFGIAGLLSNSLGPALGELVLSLQSVVPTPDSFYAVFLMAAGFKVATVFFLLAARNIQAPTVTPGEQSGLLPILRRRESRLMMGAAFIFGGIFGVLMSFGKNYTVSLGLTYVSVLLWAYSCGAISSRVFMRQITVRLSEKRMIPLGLGGVGLTLLLLAGADNYWLLGASGALYGLSHGILYPTLFVRFIGFQGPREIGRSATLFQGAFSAGWGLYPLAGGLLLGWSGFPGLFLLLALLALLAIPLHARAERIAWERARPA